MEMKQTNGMLLLLETPYNTKFETFPFPLNQMQFQTTHNTKFVTFPFPTEQNAILQNLF
jgi:hypothetical protein